MVQDRFGRAVRLTDERVAHILEHKEMAGQLDKVGETLLEPNVIVRSQPDPDVHLYHKHYPTTPVTDKYLLVAVKSVDTMRLSSLLSLRTRSKQEKRYGKNEGLVRSGGRFP